MKTKLLFSVLLAFSFLLSPCLAQVPQGFNYQAIARDGSGNPITGATMQVKIGILSDTIANTMVWEELFNPVRTNAFGMFAIIVGTGVKQTGSAATFGAIDWTKTPLFLRTSIFYPGAWKVMGTSKLQSVPYSMIAANLEGAVPLLSVKGNTTTMDSALFVVRNNTGQIVFAVYNEGVRIYVDDGMAKGARKGGFAIGSFDKSKGTSQPLFVVDPDSIRAYIDNNPVKAVKGGFAIGGFDQSKLTGNQQFLTVSDDSVRIYIDDNLTKAAKGGFAIGGFDKSKGGNTNFLNVATDANGLINPSQNRILWYPLKNAFLTGKVLITDSANVGVNSFATGYESRAKGRYSQAMGFKAFANGDYSTAIGKNAVANHGNSFAFGDSAQASGNRSFAFGSWDVDNFFNHYPTEAIGDNSIAMGLGAKASGKSSFSFGSLGYFSVIRWPDLVYARNIASGDNSMALGFANSATNGYSMVFGIGNTSTAYRGFSIGYNNYTNGDYSHAIGRQNVTMKAATSSTTLGYGLIANEPNSTIVGVFNDTLSTNVQFAVGNGLPGMLPTRRNALTILKNGNVGIGTSSPVATLDVVGNMYIDGKDMTNDYGITFREGGSTQYGAYLRYGGSDLLTIGTRNSDIDYTALQILRGSNNVIFNGNVGIGTPTPQGKIAIRNGLYGGLLINVNSDGTTWKGSYTNIQTGNYAWLSGDTWSDLYLQGKGGDVGIGILGTGGYKLYVNGTAYSTGGWAGSDVRWKKNIIPLTYVLDKLLNLNGVNYEWRKTEFPEINFDSGQQIGLIAQEVEKIFPELVRTDNNGYKAVSYEKLSVVLLEGLKEQQKEIDELKSLVNSLVANQGRQGSK